MVCPGPPGRSWRLPSARAAARSLTAVLGVHAWMGVLALEHLVVDVFLQWSKRRSLSVMPKSVLDLGCQC